jgi:alkylation response protein AidB-like acyl-CoA dehydrogenase
VSGNFFLDDPNLDVVCATVLPPAELDRARPHLLDLGAVAAGELDRLAAEADRTPPRLVDGEVERQPAYVAMERLAFARFGLAAMSHRPGVLGWPGVVPHAVKYALSYLFAQSEFGLLCPVSVTDSTSRMLRHYGSEALKARYLDRLTATDFDRLWQGTQWMTEKTGGSDVGALTTIARPEPDGTWRLWGDKWFCSNANADVALTLARPQGAPAGTRGLAMFLVPRLLPDGSRNAWSITRLKDKLGSRSMATGEVTYAGAVAWVVGDVARGFHQMMEMVNVSRLSNAMRAAGIMRRCVRESLAHARQRLAYGRRLVDLPLLRANLLEMLLDAEAAASVVLNAAAVLDRWDGGEAAARPLFRILTPLAKCWITARARHVAGEAMSVRGGDGYVEDQVHPRLLRDAHLGAIWEGSTNVIALDVQRAILRDGGLGPLLALVTERLDRVGERAAKPLVDEVRGGVVEVEREVAAWGGLDTAEREMRARPTAEALYHVLAGALLLGEGQALQDHAGSARKLLAAALYLRRWRHPRRPQEPVFDTRHVSWLETLADWTPAGLEALAAI